MTTNIYIPEKFTNSNGLDIEFDEPVYIIIQNKEPTKIILTREEIKNTEIDCISKTTEIKPVDGYSYTTISIPKKFFNQKNKKKLDKKIICGNKLCPLVMKFI